MGIIACTAYDDIKTKKKCKEVGMDGILIKPTDKKDLNILMKVLSFQWI